MNMRKRAYHFSMAMLLTLTMVMGLFANMCFVPVQAADGISAANRHMVVNYTRPAKDYEGWSLWVWEVGGGDGSDYTGKITDGVLVIDIPVHKDCEQVGMVLHQTVKGDPWAKKDGGDRIIKFPTTQHVKKLNITKDGNEVLDAPDNVGYQPTSKEGEALFLYRDDTLYYNNKLETLKGKVQVEVDGTLHDMDYDAVNKRFSYTATGVTEDKHYYRYIVDGVSMVDAYNADKEDYKGNSCSYITYKKSDVVEEPDEPVATPVPDDASVSIKFSADKVSYNDNTVLQVESANVNSTHVKSITADLTAVGGAKDFVIDAALMEGTISVTDTTALGKKEIPVTVTLTNNVVLKVKGTLEVVERTYTSDKDFDWDEAIIYFMVTDRFYDGNESNNTAVGADVYDKNNAGLYHGGDFAGVTKKLDYLKDLGINTIWITPIVDNIPSTSVSNAPGVSKYAAYHGYWARDFEKLNPNLGTEEEFRTLIEEAHKRGLKIMVDVVVNHAGYGTSSSPIFEGMFRSGGNDAAEIQSSVSGLPDFLTELPKVRNKIIAWQTAWMKNYDIDYFRVDTVKHVEDTTWKAFKNSLTKEDPAFKLIGERWDASYTNPFGHLRTGTMDSVLDFSFNTYAYNFVQGNMAGTEIELGKRNASINNTATLGSFLSSHDEDGLLYLLTELKGEETAKKLILAAASLQITAKGQPVIYYGEEIGLSGANNYPYQDNRYDFDWSLATDNNPIFAHYKKMLNIRNTYSKILAKGNRTSLAKENRVYTAFSRTYKDEAVIAGINVTDAAITKTVPVPYAEGTKLQDVYNNKAYVVSSEKTVELEMPAVSKGGTAVLVAEDGVKVETGTSGDNGENNGETTDKTVSVALDATGGKVKNSVISVPCKNGANSTYGTLPEATRTGYTFLGWYTAQYGGEKVTATSKLVSTSNHSLYAKWTKNKYQLKFDAKGGKSSVSSKTVTYYGKYGTLPTATRSGYTFKGWYTAGGTKVSSSSVHRKAGDVTLVAKWSSAKCKIVFDANGGKINGTSSSKFTKNYVYGKAYGSLKKANRSGYTFTGWYTGKTSGKKVTEKSVMDFEKGGTLYARWKKVAAPSQGKISSLASNGSQKATVKLGSISGVSGYEIQYSVKSHFKSNYRTVRTTKTSYTISSLSSNQKYYVRVRAYRIDSRSQRIYGAWSDKQTVVVK